MKKFLVYLFQEYDKEITDDLVGFWMEQLDGINVGEAWEVAKGMHKQTTYGEPRVQNFFHALFQKRASEAAHFREMRRRSRDAEKARQENQEATITEEQRKKNLEVIRGWLKDPHIVKSLPAPKYSVVIQGEQDDKN